MSEGIAQGQRSQSPAHSSAHGIDGSNHQRADGSQSYKDPKATFGGHLKLIADVKSMLKRFKIVKFRQTHQEIADKRTPETGSWFISLQDVETWIEKAKGVLWVTGGPGAGKTFIACAVIEWLDGLASSQRGMVVLCAYLRYTEQLSTWGVLLGLIFQIIPHIQEQPGIAALIEGVFERHSVSETKPTLKELTKLFKDVLKQIAKPCISIDGLDEMGLEVQTQLIEILADTNAHIIVTCRPSVLLEDLVKDATEDQPSFLHVEAQAEDIELFFTHSVKRTPGFRRLLDKHGLRQEILSTMTDNAGGMFLHAALQFEALQGCVDPKTLRERVNQFPAKLEDLFAVTLQRIKALPEDQAKLAIQTLVWLANVSGTVSMEDILCAVAFSTETYQHEPGRVVLEEQLLSVCCGLVIVETTTRIIRLVHYTAREALLKLLLDYRPYPHVMIARTCITRLIDCGLQRAEMKEVSELLQAFKEQPLLKYTHQSLAYHLQEGRKYDASLEPVAYDFARGCTTFPHFPAIDTVWDNEPLALLTPLHVAALYNLPELIFRLVYQEGVDVNSFISTGDGIVWTSLQVAAAEGNIDALDELLKFPGVAVNTIADDTITPLMTACFHNRYAAVERLLKAPGVDLKHRDSDGHGLMEYAAATRDEALVKLLLGVPEMDANSTRVDGWTPLMLAANAGDEAIVRLLLDASTDNVNYQHMSGHAALHYAASKGHLSIVKLLSEVPGIDLNMQGSKGKSPLLEAIEKGHHAIVEYLLSTGSIDLDIRSAGEAHPLHIAAAFARGSIMTLLRGIPGIDLNVRDDNGRTPLMTASMSGWMQNHFAILKLLLEVPEVDVNLRDSTGGTALHVAVIHGDPGPTLEALLQRPEIDVNIRDNNGSTPLALAVSRGPLVAVQKLLAFPGIDVNIPDSFGTPLMTAAFHGLVDKFQALFAVEGVDLHYEAENGFSIVGASVHSNNPVIYEPILELFAKEMSSNHLRQAVHMASLTGNQSLLATFLDNPDVEVNRQSPGGWTPLMAAAQRGHEGVVDMLLRDPRTDPNIPDNEGWTPLMVASHHGFIAVVQRLLQASTINVNQQTKAGQTALIWACPRGQDAVVQALLSVPGINIDHQDEQGLSAFMAAAMYGHLNVVQTLYDKHYTPLAHSQVADNAKTGLSLTTRTGETALVLTLSSFHLYTLPDPRVPYPEGFFCSNELVFSLLDHPEIQALANQADDHGRTPLMLACHRGNLDVVQRLLTLPVVDREARDSEGRTALDYAGMTFQDFRPQIVKLLEVEEEDRGEIEVGGSVSTDAPVPAVDTPPRVEEAETSHESTVLAQPVAITLPVTPAPIEGLGSSSRPATSASSTQPTASSSSKSPSRFKRFKNKLFGSSTTKK